MAEQIFSQYNKALAAYNKRLNANQGLQPGKSAAHVSNQPNILRKGDNIEMAPNQPSFPAIVNEILKSQAQKIKHAEHQTQKAQQLQGSMVQIMEAVNESELALQAMVVIRDKFITAYQEILKMPI